MALPDEASRCRNCGTVRVGEYCHGCGQRRLDARLPLRELLAEALREVSDLEGRLAKTLWTLVRHPGQLTSDFLEGRRGAFLSPVRLYLLSSVAFAGALAFSDDTVLVSMDGPNPGRGVWLRAWVWSVLFMMPAFAGLMKLLISRAQYMAEHLVFAMHVHALGYLTLGLVLPTIELSPWGPFDLALLGLAPLVLLSYLALAVHRFYETGPVRTVLGSIVVSACYLVLQAVSLVAVGALVAGLGA